MSTMSLATVVPTSLADAIDESLSAALAGRPEPCLWCGGLAVEVAAADIWSGAVTTRCVGCGSELSGTVPRHLREVPR